MQSESKALSADPIDSKVDSWQQMMYGAVCQIQAATATCWWSGESLKSGDPTPSGAIQYTAGSIFEIRTDEEIRLLRCVGAGATLKVMPHSSKQVYYG